jgi:hypothetical protein
LGSDDFVKGSVSDGANTLQVEMALGNDACFLGDYQMIAAFGKNSGQPL